MINGEKRTHTVLYTGVRGSPAAPKVRPRAAVVESFHRLIPQSHLDQPEQDFLSHLAPGGSSVRRGESALIKKGHVVQVGLGLFFVLIPSKESGATGYAMMHVISVLTFKVMFKAGRLAVVARPAGHTQPRQAR